MNPLFFKEIKIKEILLAAAMVLSVVFLGYEVEQHEFTKIIFWYTLFFAVYFFAIKSIKKTEKNKLYFYLATAVMLRLILLFSFPNLSNDVYRFIWDGRLLVQGFNPFDHLPVYYLEEGNELPGLTADLFQSYGSKNFYTVYPPVAQAQFGSACWLFSNSIYWSAVVMKGWLLLFEIGSIWLLLLILNRLGLPEKNVLLYALNPLVVIEIMGNIHFEGAMVFFFLLAFWWLLKNKLNWSAVAFALSISSKLLTLLFLPFLVNQIGWKKSIKYFAITGMTTILLFVPIFNHQFLLNFGSSLNLYFQKLEFNASAYYFLRWIGIQLTGYNQISILGPILGILAGLGILWLGFVKYKTEFIPENISKPKEGNWFLEIINFKPSQTQWVLFPKYCLFAICLYLMATTTMHPWYTILPIAICAFTQFRFPIIWSYLIFWTYINYSYMPYHENLLVVAIEYLVVFAVVIYELNGNRKKALSL